MIVNFVLSGVWIFATAIGVSSIIEGDIGMMVVYTLSGGLGKWIAIKWFEGYTYRNTIYKRIKNKDPAK